MGTGKLLDAVYYNNLKCCGKGLTHSSDEVTGEKSGFDEIVWADLQRLPSNVGLIVFVAACYSGGHLRDAKNGKFSVLENNTSGVVGAFNLEDSGEEVDAIALLLRQGSGWVFRLI